MMSGGGAGWLDGGVAPRTRARGPQRARLLVAAATRARECDRASAQPTRGRPRPRAPNPASVLAERRLAAGRGPPTSPPRRLGARAVVVRPFRLLLVGRAGRARVATAAALLATGRPRRCLDFEYCSGCALALAGLSQITQALGQHCAAKGQQVR
eukprot:scaffold1068_cov375-Prasinococcus_capsulatus_cf.AAC.25